MAITPMGPPRGLMRSHRLRQMNKAGMAEERRLRRKLEKMMTPAQRQKALDRRLEQQRRRNKYTPNLKLHSS